MKNKVKIAVLDSYVRTDKILFKNSIHISSFGKYYDEKNYLTPSIDYNFFIKGIAKYIKLHYN